jgi:DNA invertase Pin-like site-specific DNA recombinase
MRIGYARVSTDDQNLALQLDALREADCKKVYEDRLGRSLKDLIELVGQLEARGVGFQSLQEAIDTTSNGGRLIFHIFGALAEFEQRLIRERTRAGLVAARARGRLGGRPKALDPTKRQLAVQLYRAKAHSIDEICRLMGISRPTLYKYVSEASA